MPEQQTETHRPPKTPPLTADQRAPGEARAEADNAEDGTAITRAREHLDAVRSALDELADALDDAEQAQ